MTAEGYCWSRTSERQVLRIRYLYLQAILRQEVGFFDSREATTSEIINSISKDASLIQEVLSEKVSCCCSTPQRKFIFPLVY
jgi:ATP-binding cassette, subfamily B (MDR/TAP), member 1